MPWLIELLGGYLITSLVSGAAVYVITRWRARHRVHPVQINVRTVVEPGDLRPAPKLMVATMSNYPKPADLSDREFVDALRDADLETLPLDANTPSVGQMVKLLRTYPSLEQLHLVTTRGSPDAPGSFAAVPLLQAWARAERVSCEIHAEKEHSVAAHSDNQVTSDAFAAVRDILESLEPPRAAKTLVDVTSGTRALSCGALLACLGPQQDAHLVGVRYQPDGLREKDSSFCMVIGLLPLRR